MPSYENLLEERTGIEGDIKKLTARRNELTRDTVEYTALSTAIAALRVRYAEVQKKIIDRISGRG